MIKYFSAQSLSKLNSFSESDLKRLAENFMNCKNYPKPKNIPNCENLLSSEIIKYLDSNFGVGLNIFEPEIHDPYKFLFNYELQIIATDRNLKFEKSVKDSELRKLLLADDIATCNLYKKNIFNKNMFALTNPAELVFLGAVYGIRVSKYCTALIAKNVLYVVMIMPKLGNYLSPVDLSQHSYLNKIDTPLKRYILSLYNPMGIDLYVLKDIEIELTFRQGYIPKNYDEYINRSNRIEYLDELPNFIVDKYLDSFKTDFSEIIRNTVTDKFEEIIKINYENEDQFENLVNTIGMIVPFNKNPKEYFLENFLEYKNVVNIKNDKSEQKMNIYTVIENGNVKEYLNLCTDRELFDDVGFVHYNSRKELVEKLFNLVTHSESFFINYLENPDFNSKTLNISFGKFGETTVWSQNQLYSSFNTNNKKFLRPGKDAEFNLYQINELGLILLYYKNIALDLIQLINKKLHLK